jgi:hypothetical protein
VGKIRSVALIAAGVLAAQSPANIEAARTQAREAAAKLSEEIRGLLAKELASGGFSGAVKVCSELAQERTRDFARRSGLDIRRVSVKHRNPANAPDEYERGKLAGFERLLAKKELPAESSESVEEDGRRVLRYLKPVVVQSMCLTCHGAPEQLPAEVRQILAARYPRDLATGYRAGELRGAVSVRIELR